ncbi:PspC domain-containing protein [Nocardioides sp.]|uniref:PspC domain-containing protein n=1 Tax=Nocardioides sp. TaxID=35761 RepID=UPI002B26CB78|nr:PspC domain-containing protein [Nocardioides sp.]
MNDIRQSLARQGLIRSSDRKILGGVSAGIGRRIGVGPWTARLLVVLVMLVLPGSSILIYPILWILMPTEEQARSYDLAPTPGSTPDPA